MPVEETTQSGRLNFYFALLSCLGGVVLGTSPETEALPVIAVFFAAFGFLFVDTLKLFSLPAPLAYAAMGLSAAYCVLNFTDMDRAGNTQIVAVAELLVMVQGILMLQAKNHRIYEQLGVFCLLQLVVAAVFSDAIHYGLLLIPIGVVGLLALGSLSVLNSVRPGAGPVRSRKFFARGAAPTEPQEHASPVAPWDEQRAIAVTPARPERIRCSSAAVRDNHSLTGWGQPWIGLLGVAPAVLLIAAVFFYILPRTMEAPAAGRSGNVLVGFNDQVHLEQFGQMLQRDDVALRVRLTNQQTGAEYLAVGDLYLRGKVLERYRSSFVDGRPTADWRAAPLGGVSRALRVPPEFVSERTSDRNFYDSVIATITCEPMRSPSLFALAPYHAVDPATDLRHAADRWTIHRRLADLEGLQWSFPRLKYDLGTHAFRDGIQTDLLSRFARQDQWLGGRVGRDETYLRELLQFDPDTIPTAVETANTLVAGIPEKQRTAYTIARKLEQWLKFTGDFQYSLNLNAEPVPGMDPIEQFLSVDRRGHCQYFASALALMLRSVDIPARIVVGYRTDEYSELGKVYLARQYHAHAWVEALVDAEQLPEGKNVYGQLPTDRYWVRLDPTPAGGPGSQQDPRRVGGMRQVFDLAQNLWDDYVVEMDRSQQRDTLLRTPGVAPLTDSYGEMIGSVRGIAQKIRELRFWKGAWGERPSFSLPAAMGAAMLALAVVVLFRIRIYQWIRARVSRGRDEQVAIPSLAFYAETLEQLARLGLRRRRGETPAEFTHEASTLVLERHRTSLSEPLERLTAAFYRLRFGSGSRRDAAVDAATEDELRELKQRVDAIHRANNRQESGSRESRVSFRATALPGEGSNK